MTRLLGWRSDVEVRRYYGVDLHWEYGVDDIVEMNTAGDGRI